MTLTVVLSSLAAMVFILVVPSIIEALWGRCYVLTVLIGINIIIFVFVIAMEFL